VAGFEVKSYEDEAVGETAKNDKGMYWVAAVTLNPRIVYGDKHPTAEEEEGLHHKAHEQCFISQSVKTEVKVNRGA
jgi:organic hydroperoxide reductase OsmC/OhrA